MIDVRDLTKNFRDICAVDHVSFVVPAGKIFGFLGPNGAGKTTTIKMLTTILAPTSGAVRVNGRDPQREQCQVRKSLGIVFQDSTLDIHLTGTENMHLHAVLYDIPFDERRHKIESLLKFVELWDRRNDFAKHYSGGMKRRLEVARALLHEPTILFLDEPTIGLDPQTRNHIWTLIRCLSRERGVTVFFTTHYMEEAERVADEVAVIDHGKIIAQGTPSALKEKTHRATLEGAFITLTGETLHDVEGSSAEKMKIMRGIWSER